MKRRFVKDYVSNQEGKERFRYVGNYYIFSMEQDRRNKRCVQQLIFALVQLILIVTAGFLNSPGSYKLYIVLPYLSMILPLLYYVMGSISFRKAPTRMQRHEYDVSIFRLMKSVLGLFFLSFFTMVGDTVFLVLEADVVQQKAEIVFYIIMIILMIMNYIALLAHNRMMKQVQEEQQEKQQNKD